MKPTIELWDFDGVGLIVPCESGVIYSNQTGGIGCGHPEAEGVFFPLLGQADGQEFQERFDFGGWSHYENEQADEVDKALKEIGLDGFIRVDRSKLSDSEEAWVHVEILCDNHDVSTLHGFGPYPRPGILTWPNSD